MSRLNWEILCDDQPWRPLLLLCDEKSVDELASGNLRTQGSEAGSGVSVCIIRGQRCQSPAALFQEFSTALQFPYYFGQNWDALDECLCDLEWLSFNKLLLFIVNMDQLLFRETEVFPVFANILVDAARHWNDGRLESRKSLRLVFHTVPSRKELVRLRFSDLGIELPMIEC